MNSNMNILAWPISMRIMHVTVRGILLAALIITLSPAASVRAASLTVNSIGDQPDEAPGDGLCKIAGQNQCTLRAAIQEANALGGADVITFDLGTATIAPQTLLPALNDDGTTIRGDGLITLDGGPGGLSSGLFINGSNENKIQGLTLVNFVTAIFIVGLSADTAKDNVIGTDGDGDTDAQEGNLISGNTFGVQIFGTAAPDDFAAFGNDVSGNRIGTNAAGTAAFPNQIGIKITNGETNTIGSDGDGQSDALERNIISGNADSGIQIDSSGGNFVTGNYIGTTADGNAALGNGNYGIELTGGGGNAIGWSGAQPPSQAFVAATRNVISGNGSLFAGAGIRLDASTSNIISRNYIGTNAAGTAKLANQGDGIVLVNGSNSNGIGAGGLDRNVISGNGGLFGGSGVRIDGSNVNEVTGNYIGTNPAGTAAWGNATSGVVITGASHGNLIGGDTAAKGNKIAFNPSFGVFIGPSAVGNTILSNSIYSNGLLGINLDSGNPAPFVTANDIGDADSGANDLMNFPVSISASTSGLSLHVLGAIKNGLPNTSFNVQFFSNATCDPSKQGEGKSLLGHTVVTTDGNGGASFQVSFLQLGVPVGDVITTTATPFFSVDPNYGPNYDGTSEFSACNGLQPFELKGYVATPWPYHYFYKGDPGPEGFNLVVEGRNGVVSDKRYSAADVCSDGFCALGLDVALREGTYSWKMRGTTAGRDERFGPSTTFTVDLTPPEASRLRSPEDGSNVSSKKLKFTWDRQPEAMRYHIQVSTTADFTGLVIDEVAEKNQFKLDRDQALTDGVTYFWHVQTQDQAGNWGDFSAPFTVRVDR